MKVATFIGRMWGNKWAVNVSEHQWLTETIRQEYFDTEEEAKAFEKKTNEEDENCVLV